MIKLTFLTLCLLLTTPVSAAGQVSQPINAQLQTSLAAFFAAKPSVHGAVAEFVSIKRWPDIKGNVRWSFPTLRHLSQRVSLIAEQGKGKTLRRWYVSVNVKWMADVITLKQDISARTVLDRSMLIQKRENIAGLRGQVWSDAKDVVGLKSLRNLKRGSIVSSNMVKRPPLIKRGDHVTILVAVAGITVRAEGIALKSGSRGDRMMVQNLRSKQRLQSVVQDAHTVSIHMGGV